MRDETILRVSPEMRKLLEEEVKWFDKQGVKITMVEASRQIAQRNRDSRKAKISLGNKKNRWEQDLGLR